MLVESLDATKAPLERTLDVLGRLDKDGQRAEADRAANRQQRNVEVCARRRDNGERSPPETGEIATT